MENPGFQARSITADKLARQKETNNHGIANGSAASVTKVNTVGL